VKGNKFLMRRPAEEEILKRGLEYKIIKPGLIKKYKDFRRTVELNQNY
jgi:hypothetical protein